MQTPVKSIIGKVSLVLLISAAFGMFFSFLFNGIESFHIKHLIYTIVYSLCIGGSIMLGCSMIGQYLSKRYPWEKNPKKTLWIILSCSMGYSALAITAINALFYTFAVGRFVLQDFIPMLVINGLICLLITFIFLTVIYGWKFFRRWKVSLVKEEKMQKELISYQYEMLRNQVNPHFLFNSLNVLTSLVENDQSAAIQFIHKLSEVYRYILDMKDHDFVSLEEEMQLVQSYIFMQKYRYAESLIVNIRLEDIQSDKVIPVSVQMLIENAIKHNIITKEMPLTIKLYKDEDYLICENNLQKKQTLSNRNGIGLNNIRDRYSFFAPLPFTYGEVENNFVVKLPLIKTDKP